ncbi:MAG: hypothetical protein LUE13_09705 [Akkermansiaceae bacterium]|nr:hypothetical protein [Akkermansiaceae bacterium]
MGEKYISQVEAATGKILDPLYFQKSSFCQFSTFAKIRFLAETVNGPGKPDHRVNFSALAKCLIREPMAKILKASTRNWQQECLDESLLSLPCLLKEEFPPTAMTLIIHTFSQAGHIGSHLRTTNQRVQVCNKQNPSC